MGDVHDTKGGALKGGGIVDDEDDVDCDVWNVVVDDIDDMAMDEVVSNQRSSVLLNC